MAGAKRYDHWELPSQGGPRQEMHESELNRAIRMPGALGLQGQIGESRWKTWNNTTTRKTFVILSQCVNRLLQTKIANCMSLKHLSAQIDFDYAETSGAAWKVV